MHDSVPVYRLLKQRVNDDQELYVLADTSYGRYAEQQVPLVFLSHSNIVAASMKSRLNMSMRTSWSIMATLV